MADPKEVWVAAHADGFVEMVFNTKKHADQYIVHGDPGEHLTRYVLPAPSPPVAEGVASALKALGHLEAACDTKGPPTAHINKTMMAQLLEPIRAAIAAPAASPWHLEYGCAEAFVWLEARERAGDALAVHQTEWLEAHRALMRAQGQPGPRTLAEVQAELDAISAAEQQGRERRLELKRELEGMRDGEK